MFRRICRAPFLWAWVGDLGAAKAFGLVAGRIIIALWAAALVCRNQKKRTFLLKT